MALYLIVITSSMRAGVKFYKNVFHLVFREKFSKKRFYQNNHKSSIQYFILKHREDSKDTPLASFTADDVFQVIRDERN